MPAGSRNRRTFLVATVVAAAIGVASGVVATQQAKLTADGGADGDFFGISTAVSGDTAVVGASERNFGEGAAYVFTRDGANWTQQQRLVPVEPGIVYALGFHAAVDGDTAVVGAISDAAGGFDNREAAYVFTRTGTTWTQQAKLAIDVPAKNEALRVSVAVDGDTIVVGSSSGSKAFVYVRTGTDWNLATSFSGSDTTNADSFGGSVALSRGTLVVGAFGKSSLRGAAYVFTGSGSTWSEQTKLTADDGANGDVFGDSVAVDGDTAMVGAPGKHVGKGAAYVFTRAGGAWTQAQKLTASDDADVGGQGFGGPVAFDGDVAVFGASGGNNSEGKAYVFRRSGPTWTESGTIAAGDPASNDQFGNAVAVAGDTAVLGAYSKSGFRGAAYVFALSGGATSTSSGYCLATVVKGKANVKHPEKSSLTASGVLDTGTVVPDFSGAATFDVGGFHLDVPAFVAKGKTRTYAANGISLTLTPATNGSSHATFSAKVVGDLAGKVDVNGPLTFHFKNAVHDLLGTATLKSGALPPRAVTSPTLWVSKAAATIKGGGNDALALTLGFATDGVVPAAAEDLTIAFGGTFTSTLAGGWVKKGNTYVHTAKAPGVTKATIDYVKGTITIAGAKLDLGAFAPGGDAVGVTILRGADTRSVGVRMALAKTKLSY